MKRDLLWVVAVLLLAAVLGLWRWPGSNPEPQRDEVYRAIIAYVLNSNQQDLLFISVEGQSCPPSLLSPFANEASPPRPKDFARVENSMRGQPEVYDKADRRLATLLDLADLRWEPHHIWQPAAATVTATVYEKHDFHPYTARVVQHGTTWQVARWQ